MTAPTPPPRGPEQRGRLAVRDARAFVADGKAKHPRLYEPDHSQAILWAHLKGGMRGYAEDHTDDALGAFVRGLLAELNEETS